MDEKQRDLPDREEPDQGRTILTRREQETAGELRLLDPQLAGLYERGVLLVRDIEQPGRAYMVAHVGRELSRGVLQLLMDEEGLEASAQELEQAPTEEKNRPRIARALRLDDDDPRVDEWFRLHRLFSGWLKWRYDGPPSEEVRHAFERFTSLLYGRVAPYYATEAELDALLDIESPTADDARRLRDLQLRLAQRNYFFGRLKNSAWVTHLHAQGFFRNPPGRQVNADDSWNARPWPEGHYLVKAAERDPEAVAAVLESVPSSNDNPVVWELVANASRQLPPDLAVRLVPSLRQALTVVPGRFHSESFVDVAVALASAGRMQAFQLADYLLYVADADELEELDGHRYRMRTDWVFPRFGWHGHQELLDRLIPALESLDADGTLRLLTSKIQRVQRLAEELDLNLLWRRHVADLGPRPDRNDVVAMVVQSTTDVAGRFAARGPDDAGRVMELLDAHEGGDFFTRIGHLVLAQVGHHMPDRIDRILGSEAARAPGFPATEIAELLRVQFRNASPEARKAYAAAVEAGPDRGTIEEQFRNWNGREPSEDETRDRVRGYQHRLLRFFRGNIPEELRGLAQRLGVLGVTPSYRDQQPAEIGSHSEAGVGGRDDVAPVSVEELAKWSADEIVDFLLQWKPGESIGSSSGLHGTLSTYASQKPDVAVVVVNRAVEGGVDPCAIEAIVDGLGREVKAGSELDWTAGLSGAHRVMSHVASLDLNGPADSQGWRRTAGRAARMIEEGCNKNSIPADLGPEVWAIMHDAAAVPAIWQLPHHADASLGAVITAELNDASGNVANAVIAAALWDYRLRVRGGDGEPSDEVRAAARAAIRQRLVPILDRWLQDEGPNAAVPRAVIGVHLPQLHLLVPDWIEIHVHDLFDGGLENPATRPTWTRYVSHARLYDAVFHASRPWYVMAAEKAAMWGAAAGDALGTREVTQRYARHLMIAILRGLLSVGDHDRLLETAYQNLSPSAWGHAYWTVFRGWTDAEEALPPDFVQRLVALWEWRVSELEKDPASAVEEAKELGWLVHTPYVPDADIIRLGQATAYLAKGQIEMYSRWDRMLMLAHTDVDGTFAIAESVLLGQIRADFPHVAVDEIRPFLAHVLSAGGAETKDRARSIINKLGGRDIRQLKDLVDGDNGEPEGDA